jgi:hypothetical protein
MNDDHQASARLSGGGQLSAGGSVGSAADLCGGGKVVAHPGGITITTHLWLTWMEIAIEQARLARRARAEMKRLYDDGDSGAALHLLSQEFRASIVAVAASAHAMDALYGSLVIPQTAHKLAQNRRGNIREALKRVFDTGKVNTPWVAGFEWLFQMRDAAAHAQEGALPPEPHPVVGRTGQAHAQYTVEAAERAVDFALAVLRWCVDHPRSKPPATVKWTTDMAPMVTRLEDQRSAQDT